MITKKILVFYIVLISVKINSQTEKALKIYNSAVEKFNVKDYKTADSLFSLSILIEANKDTYFNRALCRGKLADRNGYCKDLINASIENHKKATELFCKSCGKIDTSYPTLNQKFSKNVILSRVITYTSNDSIKLVFYQKYFSQQSDSIYVYSGIDGDIFKIIETPAEFPGGTAALLKFMRDNTRIPSTINTKIERQKVFLRFIVFEDGTLHEITVTKGTLDCPDCDEEATRVIAIMPRWNAAKMNGRKVKCYFNINFNFAVYN